tara:strand:- start:575 stop:970 length:396 start_codon:yes stop_codon:yes gene_type:complete
MNNMTMPQLLMMLNPGAANTTYMQPDQETMLRNQSISPYTPQGGVQMPNMQAGSSGMATFITGLLGGANVGSGAMTDADADRLRSPTTGMVSDKEAELQMIDPRTGRGYPVGSGVMTDADAQMIKRLYGVR